MKLPKSVKLALDLLYKSGYRAYLVGGSVRDFLRGIPPSDYDIATPSTPEETKKVFEGFPVFLQGERHGTVGVIIDGEKLEITTFRSDGEYLNHRSPENVTFSRNIKDDLSRRDFTVNAMAWSPENNSLVDFFGGKADIENKIIRTVGDSDTRFEEDALRILRAVRFSAKLGYEVEDATKKSIFKNKHLLSVISAERIREELEKIISTPAALDTICEYAELFQTIFKDFDAVKLRTLFDPTFDLSERLSVFFLCTGEGIDKLKFSRERSSYFKNVCSAFYDTTEFNTSYNIKKGAVRYGIEPFRTALKIKRSTEALDVLDKARASGECILKSDLNLSGKDLISEGFEAGENIGKILDTLFELVIKGKIKNEKNILINEAKKL